MNICIFKGNLTRDPEVKYTSSTNAPYTTFSIAVPRKKIKEEEERQVDFINCTAWGKTGEFVAKYFTKGQQILVSGKMQVRAYQDQNGQNKTITNIVVEECEFCGNKAPQPSQQQNTNVETQQTEQEQIDDIIDDLPF